VWKSGALGRHHISISDVESSVCNDFSLISEEERLAGPVKSEAPVNTIGLGLRRAESSTKSPLGRVALRGKGQLRGTCFSETASLAWVWSLWSDPSNQEQLVQEAH